MSARFPINAGGNWSSTSTWAASSNQTVGGSSVPTTADAVTVDSHAGNVTLDTGGPTCASINFTSYTGTLTWTTTLTVAGAVTLASGMTNTGAGDLICTTTATLTSGGATLSGGLQLQGTSQTFTFSGAWVVTGVGQTNGSGLVVMNGSTLTVAGGWTNNVQSTSGSTAITLTGGTWQGTAQLFNTVTINGNVTLSGTVGHAGLLTCTSGIVTTTGSTYQAVTTSKTLSTGVSSIVFNNFTWTTNSGSITNLTINSQLNVSGMFFVSSASTGVAAFAGTAGFNVANMVLSTAVASKIVTLHSTNTYTVTGSLVTVNTTGAGPAGVFSNITLNASSGGSQAKLNLQAGATQFVGFVNATDIDSSGGQKIYSYQGTLSNATNWTNVVPKGIFSTSMQGGFQ